LHSSTLTIPLHYRSTFLIVYIEYLQHFRGLKVKRTGSRSRIV